MIFSYLNKFFEYFKEDRKIFIKYSVLSLIAGMLELFGVALVYPFIVNILSKNGNAKESLLLGAGIVILFILKNIFMIFYVYVQAGFTNNFEAKVKKQFINHFLVADYNKISKISLAQKNKIFTLLIPNVMNNFILRLLNLNVNLFIFCLISILIAIKFPLATIITTICGAFLILAQNILYKPVLTKVSKNVSKYALLNSQSYNEIALNTKAIKIANKEKFFEDKYNATLETYTNNNKKLSFLCFVPPYVTEPCIIILLLIMLTVISFQTYSQTETMVASYALIVSAIFRLAPTISRIQVNYNGINGALPMVKEFMEIYGAYNINNDMLVKTTEFENFVESIELKQINFSYDSEKRAIFNVNLKINKGEFIGIAGLSGAGKTTLIDIVSGLYNSFDGEIIIDGRPQEKPLRIGYIPQEFSLITGSIRENVAFGCSDINDSKVIEALQKAQIYDFIKENYKEGIYAEPIVDSVGFSVGQKQRIAIARALYMDSDILIFDEATSSLDVKTEDEICNVLISLKGQKTIIVVAHRLSAISQADRIVFMEKGSVSKIAPYEELIAGSEGFRKLVEISNKNTIKDI